MRLLHASDLHLTARRNHFVDQLRQAVEGTRPRALILGGDLVDRESGLATLEELIAELGRSVPVLVVPGNHDQWVGIPDVREATLRAGGYWLVDNPVSVGDRVQLCGTTWQRNGPSHLHVLCSHDPEVFDVAAAVGFELVLAGNAHGGGLVLWCGGDRNYPGAWFRRFAGQRFASERATMIVSRGVSDVLPVRLNCPREVVCIDLLPAPSGFPDLERPGRLAPGRSAQPGRSERWEMKLP